MMDSYEVQTTLAAASIAVAGHRLFWRRRDPQPIPTVLSTLVAHIILVHHLYGLSSTRIAGCVIIGDVVFAVTLVASMVIYRLWFHPLRHLPAPTPLASASLIYRYAHALTGKQSIRMTEWHEQLGDYVRYGPQHVSVTDPALIDKIMCVKPVAQLKHAGSSTSRRGTVQSVMRRASSRS